MSALNDLITGAFLGTVVVGTLEKAVLELAELYREIDRYDKICTEVRNELTAAGIPELTEDRLTVLSLAKRVKCLGDENAQARKVIENYSDRTDLDDCFSADTFLKKYPKVKK
jgi:hypothetical protein